MNQHSRTDTASLTKKRILICDHYMEVGGAERALIGLLSALDLERYDVDLFINQHTGEFMNYIPPRINLIPQIPTYSALLRPMKQILREGHIGIVLRRLKGQYLHYRHQKQLVRAQLDNDESVLQYVARETVKGLPSLNYLGEYDLAISFRAPHNIVLEKVRAKRKICWIHTDYSSIYVNRDIELRVWEKYSNIISISDEVTKSFVKTFPELAPKIIQIENILSSNAVAELADIETPTDMTHSDDCISLLSIGRFSTPKKFQEIPRICRGLLDMGLNVRWYIIGYGDDVELKKITDAIVEYGVPDNVIILGKRPNPYPYIKICDWYVQPSLYEGKSVAVREAQLLRKPVIITDYPTASSQVNDKVDGIIVPLEIDGCIRGIYHALTDRTLKGRITSYLRNNDLSNTVEINKLYAIL